MHGRRWTLALSARDDASASVDEAQTAESDLLKEIKILEVDEPELEEGAENAALTVGLAMAFGAAVWAVLGKTKGEGRTCDCRHEFCLPPGREHFGVFLSYSQYFDLFATRFISFPFILFRVFRRIFAGAEFIRRQLVCLHSGLWLFQNASGLSEKGAYLRHRHRCNIAPCAYRPGG